MRIESEIGDSRYSEELQGIGYHLLLDSQDLDAMRDYLGEALEDATGFITWSEDGDFEEVWVTESSSPYSSHASYLRVR